MDITPQLSPKPTHHYPSNNTINNSATPPPEDFDIQKQLICKCNNMPLKPNSSCFLISLKWFSKWDSFSSVSTDLKTTNYQELFGKIDNSDLVDEEEDLLPNLKENVDYKILTQMAWKNLNKWYDSNITLQREILARNGSASELVVNVYPVTVKVHSIQTNTKNGHNPGKILYSFKTLRSNSLHYISGLIKQKYRLDREYKIIRLDNSTKFKNKKSKTLQDIGIKDQLSLGIKLQKTSGNNSPSNFEGKTIKEINILSTDTFNDTSSNTTEDSSGSVNADLNEQTTKTNGYIAGNGLTGLNNLGNTCFMNSALQCLSNTEELTKYFLTKFSVKEINRENPLGMGGEVALAYYDLVKQLWKNNAGTISPKRFKSTIGKFASQFMGYSQHDSQEFLAFLFDGLHEDLNRIKTKPYTSMPEAKNRPDKEIADEIWDLHKKRNDSIIVDLFQGMFKSTLTCPSCENKSLTFDPFMYLSLPLPTEKTTVLKIKFVKLPPDQNLELTLRMPNNKTFKHVRELLREFSKSQNIFICEIFNHHVYKVFEDTSSTDSISERDDIYAYETEEGEDKMALQMFIASTEEKLMVEFPLFINFSTEELSDYSLMNNKIMLHLNKYTTADLFKHSSKEKLYQILKFNIDSRSSCTYNYMKNRATLLSQENIGSETFSTNSALAVLFEGDSYEALFKEETSLSLDKTAQSDVENEGNSLWREFEIPDVDFVNTLTLPEDIKIKTNGASTAKKEKTYLKNCITEFLKPEKLGKQDEWYCPICKKHVTATKKFDLYSLPEHLVVHLKRFNHMRYFSKINDFVDFPVNGLDLTDLARCIKMKEMRDHEPVLYDLYAISNHYGGMGGGHYTAYCKNYKINQWVEYDDSRVGTVSEDSIKTNAAYLLFYKRRETTDNTNNSKI